MNPFQLLKSTKSIDEVVVCFLLGNSLMSEFYVPTFRNTLFHLHRRVGMKNLLHTYPPMKMEQTECSETLAYIMQTPGNYPEESTQHSEHGESLKSRIDQVICTYGSQILVLFVLKIDVYRRINEITLHSIIPSARLSRLQGA
jgi:hypothetical protein